MKLNYIFNMTFNTLLCLIILSVVVSCSSPQDRAANAEAEYTEEKTKTLQEYKDCIAKAEQDKQKLEQCELLLKAVDAVEGKE